MTRTALLAGHLLDGRGGVFEDAGVVLEDGRISAVGTRAELEPLLSEAEVRDLGAATILPGLIDAHVHVTFTSDGRPYADLIAEDDAYLALQALDQADRHFRAGVTTMRDLGARGTAVFGVKRYLETHRAVGPRLLVAGRPITPTGGHLDWCGGTADGTDGVRRLVRQLVREGADAIKLVASGGGTHGTVAYRPSFSVEELAAAVEAAHDAGLPTAAHCHAVTGIERAAVAGVDCLEHVSFLVEPAGGAAAQRFGSAWSGYAAAYDERVVERIAEAGCLVSCTLLGGSHALRELRAREADGEVLDEADRRRLTASREHVERKLSIFSALVRDGLLGRIVISTDAGPGDTRFGELHHALALAVEAGVTPVQAIEAATRNAAEACRIDRTTGTLEPGKDADVLVVAGNAGRDIAALDDVVAVYRRGTEPRA